MSNNKENIALSILGCGWLGLPLAEKLIAEGFTVKGSTSTTEKLPRLKKVGIAGFQIHVTEDAIDGNIDAFLDGSQLLIINIPPGLRGDPASDFTRKMGHLISAVEASRIEHVLFVSSTSVFEDGIDIPDYTEADRPNGRGETSRQLTVVERVLMGNANFNTTVLRFGGLCGPGRDPRSFLGRRHPISNPEAPVNLIHQDDCIALILRIIAIRAWNDVFHGVHPDHPARNTFADERANNGRYDASPSLSGKPSIGKIVSSKITREKLEFQFTHTP